MDIKIVETPKGVKYQITLVWVGMELKQASDNCDRVERIIRGYAGAELRWANTAFCIVEYPVHFDNLQHLINSLSTVERRG